MGVAIQLIIGLAALFVGRQILLAIYRLFFHPLSGIPGPKLAAISWNYERYFDVYQGAQFWRQIGELHKQYGPVVRINPNEVHIADPELVDTVYPQGSKKVDKDPYLMSQFGALEDAAFMTMDHDTHRMRRASVNRFFSKAAVSKLEPYIRRSCEKFAKRLLDHADTGPLQISSAYSSFVTDVVSEYCFGYSFQYMDRPGFLPNMQAANNGFGDLLPTLRMFPWISILMRWVTPEQLIKMNPGMGEFLRLEAEAEKIVVEAKGRLHETKSGGYLTIVDELLRADLPESEKRTQRLALETQGLIAAAIETTGTTLTLATYYLYADKARFNRLRAELLELSSHRTLPNLAQLEALPYLSAVMIEVLRLSGGPLSRLPRVFPADSTILRSSFRGKFVVYTVPPGTVLSMSSIHIHRNSELFPDPDSFIPERWLDEQGKRVRDKERYLLHFSKGTRGCVGFNLANAMMYLCLAALMLQVDDRLELYETGLKDVTPFSDAFAPRVYRGSKGVRVVIS